MKRLAAGSISLKLFLNIVNADSAESGISIPLYRQNSKNRLSSWHSGINSAYQTCKHLRLRHRSEIGHRGLSFCIRSAAVLMNDSLENAEALLATRGCLTPVGTCCSLVGGMSPVRRPTVSPAALGHLRRCVCMRSCAENKQSISSVGSVHLLSSTQRVLICAG